MTNPETATGHQRKPLPDLLRGLAILLMVVFHFCYDLSYFGYADFNIHSPFWTGFRTLILTLFFIVSGYSFYLAHGNGFRQRVFVRRFTQLFGSAAAITLVTRLLFPQSWIYFGILHFFVVAQLIMLVLCRHPRLNLIVTLGVFVCWISLPGFNLHWLYIYLQPVLDLPYGTQDITRLVPWISLITAGLAFAQYRQHLGINLPPVPLSVLKAPAIKLLALCGRHPLKIYLLHQPLLFGAFSVLQFI